MRKTRAIPEPTKCPNCGSPNIKAPRLLSNYNKKYLKYECQWCNKPFYLRDTVAV